MKYEIVKPLSDNPNTYVYLCKNSADGELYTVKKILSEPALQHQIEVECDIAAKISHPWLPHLVEVTEEDGFTVFVYSYIEGISLQKYLDIYGPATPEKVIHWFIQLCEALHYLHTKLERPVIHRDIKPDNLIIDNGGNIHLIDLDIARYSKHVSLKDTIQLGSVGFAAPEQYGSGQSDEKTDIYGLGVSMYFALTGHSLTEPPYQVLPPHMVSKDIPKSLSEIIVKCTRTDPSDRYVHACDLLEEIKSLQTKPTSKKRANRRTVPYICSVVVAICAVAIVYMITSSRPYDNLALALQPSASNVQAIVSASPEPSDPLSSDVLTSNEYEATDNVITEYPDDMAIVFTDAELERLIRSKLSINDDEQIAISDLATIQSLYIAGRLSVNTPDEFLEGVNGQSQNDAANDTCLVVSVDDLCYCVNLTELYINSKQISDISPIANLTNLETITFQFGQIQDIGPIANLQNLKNLNLSVNPVQDYTPIASLTNLESLTLEEMVNGIDSLDFVSGLTNLQDLLLWNSGITNIEPIRNLDRLSYLRLSANNIEDISPISGKPNLECLYLQNNLITDISSLQNLPKLKTLSLADNLISDITPLLGFRSLTHLELQGNSIIDFSGIDQLTQLQYIDVSGNPGADSDIMDLLEQRGVEVIR
jgi:serine/threonine protein kinase